MNQGDEFSPPLPKEMELSSRHDHWDKQEPQHKTKTILVDLINDIDPKPSVDTGVSDASSTLHGAEIAGIANDSKFTSSPKFSKRKRVIRIDNLTDSQVKPQSSTLTTHAFKRLKPIPGGISASTKFKCSNDHYLYGLTRSIWGLIFQYLPPATLAHLLRVSCSFNSLLATEHQETAAIDPINDHATECASELIWRKCHELFAPGLPSPAQGQTELSMWKLIKGNRCQRCGQKKPLQTATEALDVWTAGPDTDHVRVLWPFLARLCGQCLQDQCQKEKELLLSNIVPSFLIEELPFMFILESGNCVSESALRDNAVPFGVKLTKIFYKPQIAHLQQSYHSFAAKNAGPLDAWTKSLTIMRTKQVQDSSRWESWERKGTLRKINRIKTKASSCREKALPEHNDTRDMFTVTIQPSLHNFQIDLKDQSSTKSQESDANKPGNQQQSRGLTRPHESLKQSDAQSLANDGKLRSGISATRESRRYEIFRRCSYLEPPVTPELLDQMSSFHMALQIEKEMDDQQWGILKDRLNSERSEANVRLQAVKEAVTQSSAGLADELSKPNNRNSLNITDCNIVPVTDATQGRLAIIARNIIKKDWNDGNSLSKDACSQFAAEVLVRTRRAYLAEPFDIADTDAAHPRLTMENMKWLFENFIRPLTEQHQKEIFLCSSCDNISKAYGFEAVIQHYAAKHTSSLSLGNVIVHWKAEWPREPPFHSNPMHIKAHAITTSTSQNPQPQPLKLSDIHERESSSGSGNDSYDKFYESQFVSARTLQRSNRAAPFPNHGKPLPQRSNALRPVFLTNGSMASSMDPYHTEPTNHDLSALNTHGLAYTDMHFTSSQFNTGLPTAGNSLAEVAIPTTEVFRAHQAEMAKLARELWFATAGIKGLPGPLRVQTIIYHASERFVDRFGVEPGVNMFLFGLNHEAAMRPLRSLNGFSCRACMLGQPGSSSDVDQRKPQTLPHLLNHFMALHAEYYRLDWRRDMIQLPPLHIISDLVHAPGMDDTKLALFVAAFPNAFPRSFPSFSHLQPDAALQVGHDSIDHRPDNTQPSINSMVESGKGYSGIVPLVSPGRNIDSPADDEYDPRRPVYLGRMIGGQQGQIITSRLSNNASYGLTQRYQPVDADRFLEQLEPHLEERDSLNSKPYPYTNVAQVPYDEVYVKNENNKQLYTSYMARSDQHSPLNGMDLQRFRASLFQDPAFGHHQFHRERGVALGPGGEQEVPRHPPMNHPISADALITPAFNRYTQPAIDHYHNLTGLDSSTHQYTQQNASAKNSRLPSHRTQHELIVVHASQDGDVDQAKGNACYSYKPISRRAHFASEPESGSFI